MCAATILSASQGANQTWKATEVFGTGWPANAGGRLVGSLASLPYALAEAEQNFLIPTREQALIWGDLVPQMILSAVIPRWWNVTPLQLHWVGVQWLTPKRCWRRARLSPTRRAQVVTRRWTVTRRRRGCDKIDELLAAGDVARRDGKHGAVGDVSAGRRHGARAITIRRWPARSAAWPSEAPEAAQPARHFHASSARPSRRSPIPIEPELLNLRTFPTLMGYSSRILAESWESNLLYYAALADEIHAAPAELNVLIPEWTQQTVEAIFATHLEDWPALLRSLRLVGDEVRRESAQAETLARCELIVFGGDYC